MAELRKLADNCDFRDHLSEALRDRLVCGLRSEATQRRLLTEEYLTLKTAYETALNMEAATRKASKLHGSSYERNSPSSLDGATHTTHFVRKKPSKSLSQKKTGPTCHRCGKTNHTPDLCY